MMKPMVMLVLVVLLYPLAAYGAEAAVPALRRSNKIEFDERLVKGQTAKSGAVYLFKRVPRTLPALVGLRRSYRQRIVQPILGKRVLSKKIIAKKKRPNLLKLQEKQQKLDE